MSDFQTHPNDMHNPHPAVGSTVSGLRFPNYPDAADSPRAVICTGTVERIEDDLDGMIIISCDNIKIQDHELANPELRDGKVRLETPWIFLTELEAHHAYVRMVEQDLREGLVHQRGLEKRVERIRKEREFALNALNVLAKKSTD